MSKHKSVPVKNGWLLCNDISTPVGYLMPNSGRSTFRIMAKDLDCSHKVSIFYSPS